jgi:hypothetical protein
MASDITPPLGLSPELVEIGQRIANNVPFPDNTLDLEVRVTNSLSLADPRTQSLVVVLTTVLV